MTYRELLRKAVKLLDSGEITLGEYDEMLNPLDRDIECIDKIIAEIEALNPVDYVSMSSYEGHRGASDMKDDVLQIIDKYKEESEE